MKDEANVTFYYNNDIVYEDTLIVLDDCILGRGKKLVKLESASPGKSFGYTSVDIYMFDKLAYWFKYQDTQYYSKCNGKLDIQFEKITNSLSFILED